MDQIILSPVPLPDLVSEIANAVRAQLAAAPQPAPPEPEELLTRKEAAGLLAVTLPTLREYTRRGYLTAYRIGTRVRYKRSEVVDGLRRMRYANTPA